MAASANSTLPAAFASPLRTFHEHCKVDSPDGGFSGGTTGSTSNLAGSRAHLAGFRSFASPVWRPRRELLFGEVDVLCHTTGVTLIENPTLQLPNAVFIGFPRSPPVHQNFQHPKEPYGSVERIIIWEPVFMVRRSSGASMTFA